MSLHVAPDCTRGRPVKAGRTRQSSGRSSAASPNVLTVSGFAADVRSEK